MTKHRYYKAKKIKRLPVSQVLSAEKWEDDNKIYHLYQLAGLWHVSTPDIKELFDKLKDISNKKCQNPPTDEQIQEVAVWVNCQVKAVAERRAQRNKVVKDVETYKVV